MIRKRLTYALSCLLLGSLLTACGGGSDADPSNKKPMVSAGAARTVFSGTTVNLNGLASDEDGNITAIEWRQVSGSIIVTITSSSSLNASFVAPEVSSPTPLTFRLTVTDDDNATSSSEVTITLASPQSSQAPVIETPIPSIEANAGDLVTLSVIANDPDGDISRYQWAFVGSEPEQAVTALNIQSANDGTPEATFVAPAVTEPTRLRFSISVFDNAAVVNQDDAVAFVTVLPLPAAARAAHVYVSTTQGVSRYTSTNADPQDFSADTSFGLFKPSGDAGDQAAGEMDFATDGRLVLAGVGTGVSLREVCGFPARGASSQFRSVQDRLFSHDVDFTDDNTNNPENFQADYRSVVYAGNTGYIIAADVFQGTTASGFSDPNAIHVYGDVAGTTQLVVEYNAGRRITALFYDEASDMLFAGTATGEVLAVDDFIAEAQDARDAAASRDTIVGGSFDIALSAKIAGPVGSSIPLSANIGAIQYVEQGDRLVVSDVGVLEADDPATGVQDGRVFIVNGFKDLVATGGATTLRAATVFESNDLGDPVDIDLSGRDLLVADAATEELQLIRNIFSGSGVINDRAVEIVADLTAPPQGVIVQPLDVVARPSMYDLSSAQEPQVQGFMVLRNFTVEDETRVEVLRLPKDFTTAEPPRLRSTPVSGFTNQTPASLAVPLNGDVLLGTSGDVDPDVFSFEFFRRDTTSVQILKGASDDRLTLEGSESIGYLDRSQSLANAQVYSQLALDEFGVVLDAITLGVANGGSYEREAKLRVRTACGTGAALGPLIDLEPARTSATEPEVLIPTDIDYDGSRGDLYISFNNGRLGIIRRFGQDYLGSLVRNPNTVGQPTPFIFVDPKVIVASNRVDAAASYTAVEFLPGHDEIVLATASANGGGAELHVIGRRVNFEASNLQGGQADVDIITVPGLVEPSALAYDGADLVVADRNSGRIFKLDDFNTISGAATPASPVVELTQVRAIVPITDYLGSPFASRLP